jgi:predicted kinase
MFYTLLKAFQEWNPALVEQMKNCSHHYSHRHLNQYHLEDDVWTHTMLVYNQIRNMIGDHHKNRYTFYQAIIALCHDIGKVYTRHAPKVGKIAMYGHAFASIQDTIEFINYLFRKRYDFELGIDTTDWDTYYYVLTIISNHMDYMMNSKDRDSLVNNDDILYMFAETFMYCDKKGSFSADNTAIMPKRIIVSENENDSDPITLDELWNVRDEHNIIMMAGPPGSGKDFVSSTFFPTHHIVSFDNIRMRKYDEYLSTKGEKVFDRKNTYKEAFEYCNSYNIDLNAEMLSEIDKLFNVGKKVIICNTNMSRKLRKSTINLIRNKYPEESIGCIYLCCDRDTLYRRDRNRVDKTVGEEVIDKFIFNQQIPVMKDGLDRIIFMKN